MKRAVVILCMLFLLAGCNKDSALDKAMTIRERLLQSEGCSFDAVITADYGESLYTFTMQCQTDAQGTLKFTVTQPETIEGITGSVSAEGGRLTFDDQVLAFQTMADGQVTPVSAPWLFIKTLRSGYLTACGQDGEYIKIAIDDSYQENALHLDIWISEDECPVRTEILWKGCRVLSLEIKNFVYV